MTVASSTLTPKTKDHRFAFLKWNPDERIRSAGPVSVTLLSGFLGAGKTTLLKHLLTQRPGGRFGLIINDVGAVNLDAEDLRRNFPEGDDTVQLLSELTAGCICCSMENELADALVYLLDTSRPSHILIEASGAANPRNILQTFYSQNFLGHSLADAFQIANVVTVIDTPSLLREWNTGVADRRRRRRIFLNDPRKPWLELIMEQIETCDVMILNKLDELTLAERREVGDLAESLNPRADRLGAIRGQIDPATLLDHARFDLKETQRGSIVHRTLLGGEPAADLSANHHETHDHEDAHHGHHHDHDHHGYGLKAVVFRAREPVVPKAFFRTLRSGLPGLVRAKGFYWSTDRPDQCGMLSLAGGVIRADHAGPWFIDMLERGRVTLEEMPEQVRRAWLEPPVGDRRQELVLIGVGLDQAEVQRKLEACLESSLNHAEKEQQSLVQISASDDAPPLHLDRILKRGVPIALADRSIPDDVAETIRTWLETADCDVDEEIRAVGPDVRDRVAACLAENGLSGASVPGAWLIDDLTDLVYRFSEIADRSSVRLRLESLRDSGCCKFHTDNLALRMLCTYVGPGTEWVPGSAACREALGCIADSIEAANRRIIPDATAIQHAPTGAVLVFKGDGFPGEEGRGLVHRSAPVSGPEQTRLRLCIDLSNRMPCQEDFKKPLPGRIIS